MSREKNQLLFDAITDIDDELIEKAYKVKPVTNYRKRSLRKKWIFILAATLILGALSVVAAEYSSGAGLLTSYLEVDKSGEAIVEEMKSNINKTVVKDAIEISMINSVADSSNLYLTISVTLPEGTDMSKGYHFYDIELIYPKGFVYEYQGMNYSLLKDDNTEDNKLYYLLTTRFEDRIPREKLRFRLKELIYQDTKENIKVGDEIIVSKVGFKQYTKVMKSRAMINEYWDSFYAVVASDEAWTFDFNLHYLDYMRGYSTDIAFSTPYNEYNISEVIINPLSISIKGHSSEHNHSFEEGILSEAIILKDGTRIDLEAQRESVTVYDDIHLSGSFNKVIDPEAVAAVVIYGEEYPVEKFKLMNSEEEIKGSLDIYVLTSFLTMSYIFLYSVLSFRSNSTDISGMITLIFSFKGNSCNKVLRDRKEADIEKFKLKAFKKNKPYDKKNFIKERKKKLWVLIIGRIVSIVPLFLLMAMLFINIRSATKLGLIYTALVFIDILMLLKLLYLDFEAKNI